MNEEIKKKLKMKIAISQIKSEGEKAMNKNGKFIIKNIGIAACVLISMTGVVFAGSKVIENIWKTPEKIENATSELTEESKNENITEEQAKEIAINKFKEIGFNTNIVGTNHYKEVDSNTIIYRFYTENNYEISVSGNTGIHFKILNQNAHQDENTEITVNEAIEIANKYYKKLGFKDGEYEITQIQPWGKSGGSKENSYQISLTYNKKYGENYNPYERLHFGISAKIKDICVLDVNNMPFDNNETIITEDEAIQIALKEDEKIETNKIIDTKVEKMIVKMNSDAYERINNKENYYKAMQTAEYPNEERNYYNIEDRIRNAWVVVITYEDIYIDVTKRYTESKYSYFVDCTTGEIIGGHTMDYTTQI